MLKIYTTLFIILIFSAARAQPDIFRESFPRSKGAKSVTVKTDYLCSKPVSKNKITARYLFDADGNAIACLSVCDNNKVCGKQLYNYVNNSLVSYQNYSTWVSVNDGSNDSRWDSTILSDEAMYTYSNNKITGIRQYIDSMKRLSIEINLSYDANGKVSREEIKRYEDSLGGRFAIHLKTVTIIKEYSYKDTITTIRYLSDSKLRSTETIRKDKRGNIIKEELKSSEGKILKSSSYKYNSKNQLSEIRAIDTGYDGFGNTYDTIAQDKIVLKYDAAGRLIAKEFYWKGSICSVERYEYSL